MAGQLRFYAPDERSQGRDRAPTSIARIPERLGGTAGADTKLPLGKDGAARSEKRQTGGGNCSGIAPRSLPRLPRRPPPRRASEPQPVPPAPLSTALSPGQRTL